MYKYDDGQDFASLSNSVIAWAEARNIIKGSDAKSQFHKLIQEAAELSESICKGKDVSDDIGDCLVVLLVIAEQCGVNVVDCLSVAYNDIKDRKGQMVNGVFVKE